MLLTLLSDTTADNQSVGVHPSPVRVSEPFLSGKAGTSSVPGCLTSEDEERETWTAESLRVSLPESFGFSDRDRTKDFGGTRFKGYTNVASDVNRGQLIGFGR